MLCGNGGNELLNQHCFADTGAAEQTDFSALRIRGEQVDDLDTCLQHIAHGALLKQRRRGGINPAARPLDLSLAVDGAAEGVRYAAERSCADRYL